MLKNSFIPVSIPNLHSYLLNKFNVDIYNIPVDDWHRLICNSYCKNIINNTYCITKYKKDINNDSSFCSKCCERKGIKRKKVYKKKTKIILNNEDSDSGICTESDDKDNRFKSKKCNIINKPTEFKLLKNKNIFHDLSKIKKKILTKIKILIYFKKLYLNNKNNKQNNYIRFGSLKIPINNNNISSLFLNKNYNKINLNNIYSYINNKQIEKEKKHVNDVLKLEGKNKHKYVMFGTLKVDVNENAKINDCNDKKKSKKENLETEMVLNNKKKNHDNGLKYLKENDFTDISPDLYCVFTYIIYLIFKTSNIKIIKDELYSCLGVLGVEYYISQFINNNDYL